VKGEPEGVYFKVSKDANHLIEEFMLLANRKVAEFIGKQKKVFIELMMNQMRINCLCKL
jgi:ribonuclease R